MSQSILTRVVGRTQREEGASKPEKWVSQPITLYWTFIFVYTVYLNVQRMALSKVY